MIDLLKKQDPVLLFGYLVLAILCLFPIFIDLPFRPNLYLAWEGAYRISNGEIPFRDFGMPLGVGFWLIPALFFSLLGPYFKVLVLVQSLINVTLLVVMRGIFKTIKLNEYYVFLLIVIFYSSMIMPNYWPWYNNMAVVYQLVSIYFVLISFDLERRSKSLIFIGIAAFFSALSIFTKQDIGFLAFFINGFVVLVYSITQKEYKLCVTYAAVSVVFILLNILPFLQYEFTYWFNFGQLPHHSRVTVKDLFQEFITGSQWIKLYMLIIFIVLIRHGYFDKMSLARDKFLYFGLVTLGILGEAAVIQFTSFNPPNGNIFFHVFAIGFILLHVDLKVDLKNRMVFIPILLLTLSWWSFNYWKYANKVLDKVLPKSSSKGEYVVSKYTWQVNTDTIRSLPYKMENSSFNVLRGVTIPRQTSEGILKIKKLAAKKRISLSELKVLNLSELTFLPFEYGYETLKGQDIPLWHHFGVSFFDREVEKYCKMIERKQFDLVLFQDVNYSNNYFPNSVKTCIESNYKRELTFRGPKGFSGNYIHVYIKE